MKKAKKAKKDVVSRIVFMGFDEDLEKDLKKELKKALKKEGRKS